MQEINEEIEQLEEAIVSNDMSIMAVFGQCAINDPQLEEKAEAELEHMWGRWHTAKEMLEANYG